jgi:hypothetical protein
MFFRIHDRDRRRDDARHGDEEEHRAEADTEVGTSHGFSPGKTTPLPR